MDGSTAGVGGGGAAGSDAASVTSAVKADSGGCGESSGWVTGSDTQAPPDTGGRLLENVTRSGRFRQSGAGKDKVTKLDTRRFPVEEVKLGRMPQTFCQKLSVKAHRKAGLPTEAPSALAWTDGASGGVCSTSFSLCHGPSGTS